MHKVLSTHAVEGAGATRCERVCVPVVKGDVSLNM